MKVQKASLCQGTNPTVEYQYGSPVSIADLPWIVILQK